MSLEGAEFICLDEAGNRGKFVLPKERKFTVGYFATCDFVLTDDKALGIHCMIERDGFGRTTIRNMSSDHPVFLNGDKVENKRNLFSDSIITILDKRYLWRFPSHFDKGKNVKYQSEEVATPEKQIGVPEHTGFSSPLPTAKKGISRFTVHNFAHYIKPDEASNSSTQPNVNIDETPKKVNDETQKEEEEAADRYVSPEASAKQHTSLAQPEREATPEPEDDIIVPSSGQGTPKMDLINCTNNKENTGSSHKKNRHQLSMCHRSEVVITSFSPRKVGVTTEKSFTAILMPKVLVTRAPNTPKSVYSTPRSVLDDDGEDDNDDQINRSRGDMHFQTPSTSQKASRIVFSTASKKLKNTSMHLVDFTTPQKFAPASPYLKSALKASAKKHLMTPGVSTLPCTPVVGDDNRNQSESSSSVQSVISVDSTDTSSVIEILSDESTPGLSTAKTPQKSDTTKIQTNNSSSKISQSLIKRSMLNNRNNKQITTPQRGTGNVQTTPRREPINRVPLRTSIAALRTTVTAKPSDSDLHGNRREGVATSASKMMAAIKFESSPSSNTKCPTPHSSSRKCFIPRSAGKAAPTTSTPLAAGSYNRYSGCNTSPLNKVRKSFGGVPLSSHISKARKSIIAAAPSKFTSIKEKSPQQKLSDKILYRARKSVGVTPMIARAINMVETSKKSPRYIVNRTTGTPRKTMDSLTTPSYTALFAEKQSKEQTIDRSLTFIVDSDEEGIDANKMTKNVGENKTSENQEENVYIESKEKQQNLNLTFSAQKENEKTLPTTDDTPVDVDEVPQCVEDADLHENVMQLGEKHKGGGAGSHISLTAAQKTEENFAEEIQNAQKGEQPETKHIENGSASAKPADKCKEVDAGFGEEPGVLATKDLLSQSKDELDKSLQVYKPIYEDITLEGSTLEKDAKDENVLETKTCYDDVRPSSSLGADESIAEYSPIIPKALTDLPDVTQGTAQGILESAADKDADHTSSADRTEISEEKACIPENEEQILARIEAELNNEHNVVEENTADEESTRRFLEEIEDVLNKSDEFERKHANKHKDNENLSQANTLHIGESNADQCESDKGEIKAISDTCKEGSIAIFPQNEDPEEIKETQQTATEESNNLKHNVHMEHNTDDIQNVSSTIKESIIDPSTTAESITTCISHDNEENNKDIKSVTLVAADITNASQQLNRTDSKQGKEEKSDDEELTSSCPMSEELESIKDNVSSEDMQAADSTNSPTSQELYLVHLEKSKYTLSEAEKTDIQVALDKKEDDEQEVEAESIQHSGGVVEESISMCRANEELIKEVNLKSDEPNTLDCKNDESNVEELKSMSPLHIDLRPESNLEFDEENKGLESPLNENDSNTIEFSPANKHIRQENQPLHYIENEKELRKESNLEAEENKDTRLMLPADPYENQQAEDDNNEERSKETVELGGNISLKKTEEADNQAASSNKTNNESLGTSVNNKDLGQDCSDATNEAQVGIAGEHNDTEEVLSTISSIITESVTNDEIEKVSQSPIDNIITVAVENSDNTEIINPIMENKSKLLAATPKRATPRKSIAGQLNSVTSLGTPSKTAFKIDSELALTPRRSLRRASLSDKSAIIENPTTTTTIHTPRRGTRRASMSIDLATSCTTPMETAKSRRASLSDVPLTPKRITRRRSSMALDPDEAVNIVNATIETSEQPKSIIYEENMEDMGAIIEEEEEESEETSVFKIVRNETETTDRDATVPSSSQQESIKKSNLLCPDIERKDDSEDDDHAHAVLEENLCEVIDDEEQEEIGNNQSNQTATFVVTELEQEQTVSTEETIVAKESAAEVALREEDEENVAEVVFITEHNIPENGNTLHSESPIISSTHDKTQNSSFINELSHIEGDVGKVVNVSNRESAANNNKFEISVQGDMIQDESTCEVVTEPEIELLNIEQGESTCEVVTEPEMELLNIEKGQPEMSEDACTAVNITTDEYMETLEVSDDESIYGYGKEVQAPFTPKLKKHDKAQAKTPKTPLLSGVRKLFNTPKPEQNTTTPMLESIRHLVRTPKIKAQDTENLQPLQVIVETPKVDLHPAKSPHVDEEEQKGLTAVRVLLKTPELCETPRFKGMRELMQTPKTIATPAMDGIKELLDDEKQSEDTIGEERCDDFDAAATTPLTGVKELLHTPKTCSTSRFKSMRELRQTPKVNLAQVAGVGVGVKPIINSPGSNLKTQSENIEEDQEEIDYMPSMQIPDELNELVPNQSISEEDHNIYRGVKELMKTPKGCSTPRFRGMREMMKTPKIGADTPVLGGVKELLGTPPKQDETNLDKFLKTPTAKNIMISTLPSSAVIEKSEHSVEMVHSIEYDLNDTHEAPCSNFGELFKTPVASRFVDRLSGFYAEDEDITSSTQIYSDMPTNSKHISSEIKTPTGKVLNRKSLALKTPLAESPFSTADILTDLPALEVEDWVDKIDPLEQTIDANKEDEANEDEEDNVHKSIDMENKTIVIEDSTANDSLSVVPETCVKASFGDVSEDTIYVSSARASTTSKDPLEKSTSVKSNRNEGQPMATCGATADISGICLLDETAESVLDYSLIVSEEDYDATNEGNMSNNNKDDTLCEDDAGDDDLSEPLQLSDDDETVEDSTDEQHKNDSDCKIKTTKSVEATVDQQSSKLKQTETLPNKSKISVDIFINDSVEDEEETASVNEIERDEILPANPLDESTAENVIGNVTKPNECEDSVLEISESIKDTTTTEPEEGIISSRNEVVKHKVVEFAEAPEDKRGVDAKETAEDTHVGLIETMETLPTDGAEKILNANVPSSSQTDTYSQTSSSEEAVCLENTNDADDVTQTEVKTQNTDNIKNATSKDGGKTDDVILISGTPSTSDEVVQCDTIDKYIEQTESANDKIGIGGSSNDEEDLKVGEEEEERGLEMQSVENIDVGSNLTPVKTIQEAEAAVITATDADIDLSAKKNVDDDVSLPLCKESMDKEGVSNESKSTDTYQPILIPDNQPSSSSRLPDADAARVSIESNKPVETTTVEMPIQMPQIEDSSDETHKNILTKTSEMAKDEIPPVEANKMVFIEETISMKTTKIDITEKEVAVEKNDTNETEEIGKQAGNVVISESDVVQIETEDIENVEDVKIENVENVETSSVSITCDDNDITCATVSESDKNSASSIEEYQQDHQKIEITSAPTILNDNKSVIDSDLTAIEQIDQKNQAEKLASDDWSKPSRSPAPKSIAEDNHFADDLNYLPSKSLITESAESLAYKVQAENELETGIKSKVEKISAIPTEIIQSEGISEPDNNTTTSMSIKEHANTKTIMTEKNICPVIEEVTGSASTKTELDKMIATITTTKETTGKNEHLDGHHQVEDDSITQNATHTADSSNLNKIKTEKSEEESESGFPKAVLQSFNIEVKIRDIDSERIEQTPQEKPNKRLRTRKGSQSSVCSKDSDNEAPKTTRRVRRNIKTEGIVDPERTDEPIHDMLQTVLESKVIEESNEQRNPAIGFNPPDSDEVQINEIESIPYKAKTVQHKETIPSETSESIEVISCAEDFDAASDINKAAEKNKVPGLAKNSRRKPSSHVESEDSKEASAAIPTAQAENANPGVSDDLMHEPSKNTIHKPSATASKPNAAATGSSNDAVQNTESEISKVPLAIITADTENTSHISSKDAPIKPIKPSSAECNLDNASVHLSETKAIDEPLLDISVTQNTGHEVLARPEEMEVCDTPANVDDTKIQTLENLKPAKRTLRKASQLTSNLSTEVVHKEKIRAEVIQDESSSVTQTHDENISEGGGSSTSSQEQPAKRRGRKPSKSERKLEKPSNDTDNIAVLQRIEEMEDLTTTQTDPKENTESQTHVENKTSESESLEQKYIKEQTTEAIDQKTGEEIMDGGLDLIQSKENAVTNDVKITESTEEAEAMKEYVKPSHQESKTDEVTEVISKVEVKSTIALVEEPKLSTGNVGNTEFAITEEEPKPASKRQRRKTSSDSTDEGSCSSHSRKHLRQKRLKDGKELDAIVENSNEISEMTEEPPTKREITRRRRKASEDSNSEKDAKRPKKISSRKPYTEEPNLLDNIKETEDECLLEDNKDSTATETKKVEGMSDDDDTTSLVAPHHSNEVFDDTTDKDGHTMSSGQDLPKEDESDAAGSRRKVGRKRAPSKNTDRGAEDDDAITTKNISQNNESSSKVADTGAQSTTTRRNRRKASQNTEQDTCATKSRSTRPHKAEIGAIEEENLSKIVEFDEKIQVTDDGRKDVLETKESEVVSKGTLQPIEICRDNQVQSKETAEEPNIGSAHHETTKRNVASKRDRGKASHEISQKGSSSSQQNLRKATEEHTLPTMEEENVTNQVETFVMDKQEKESGKDSEALLSDDESLNEKCIKATSDAICDLADDDEPATRRTRLETESKTEGGDINKNDDEPKNIDKTRRRKAAPVAQREKDKQQSEKPISRSRQEVQMTNAIQPDKKIYSRSRRDRKVSTPDDDDDDDAAAIKGEHADHDQKPLIKAEKTDHDDHSEYHKDDETLSVKSGKSVQGKIDGEEKLAADAKSSTRSRRARKVDVNEKKHDDVVDDKPSTSAARGQKTKNVEELDDNKSLTRSKRGGRIVHSAAEESATDKTEKIEEQDSNNRGAAASRNRAAAATRKKPVEDKNASSDDNATSEIKESDKRGNRRKKVTEEVSSRRGRNVPQRRAATCHHNYDETSDTEQKEKKKKKLDSPKKPMESPKNVQLDSNTLETSLLSSSAVTARGRTRKPTARVQQFLEEERARAGTPKKRATDTPTKGKHLKFAANTADDDADVTGLPPQTTNLHKVEPETTSPTTSKRRKGTRKAKVADTHEDPDEPPAKKSPTVVEAKKEAPTPTRIADRRNAAAAALFRIEEDALATAAIDPPKKSRARKQPAKGAAVVPTTSDDNENAEQTDSSAKQDTKITAKRGTRKAAAASATEAAHAAGDGLPTKRSRKVKVTTEAYQSETEATADAKTKHNAATTRAGRKNVQFKSANQNAESAVTEEETATTTAAAAATTTKTRATRSRQV